MIAYLEGKIIAKKDKFIILEVANIGYKVFLSRQTLAKLPENADTAKFFCFHNVKEDASDLYGFFTYDELTKKFYDFDSYIKTIFNKSYVEFVLWFISKLYYDYTI